MAKGLGNVEEYLVDYRARSAIIVLTHRDRLRDRPLEAGATGEANPFAKVPTPAERFIELPDRWVTAITV